MQRAIGRRQSYEETEVCAVAARALGVDSLNLDLIYGLPLQTTEGVVSTARRALDLKADRIAVFGYAHVPWMKRHQALIPEDQLPGPLDRYVQASAIQRVLTQEGRYVSVGLDHYALPDDPMAKAVAARRLKRGFQGYTTDAAPVLIGLAPARSALYREAMCRTRQPPLLTQTKSKQGGSPRSVASSSAPTTGCAETQLSR